MLQAIVRRPGTRFKATCVMTEASFTWMARAMASVAVGEPAPAPGRGRHTGGSPRYGLWLTLDDKALAAAPLEQAFWDQFCDVIGLPDRFRDEAAPADEARAAVAARIRSATAEEWLARFEGVDACAELIQGVDTAMAAPERAARLAAAKVGRTVPAVPLSGFGAAGTRAAPALGSVSLDAAIWP